MGLTGGYPPVVADDVIPPALLTAQRAFDAATAAVKAASARPGPTADWTPKRREELGGLRVAQRVAMHALYDARAGTEYDTWDGWQKVEKAARGDA